MHKIKIPGMDKLRKNKSAHERELYGMWSSGQSFSYDKKSGEAAILAQAVANQSSIDAIQVPSRSARRRTQYNGLYCAKPNSSSALETSADAKDSIPRSAWSSNDAFEASLIREAYARPYFNAGAHVEDCEAAGSAPVDEFGLNWEGIENVDSFLDEIDRSPSEVTLCSVDNIVRVSSNEKVAEYLKCIEVSKS
ncbi:Piso0_003833 [Millerozyma farinosa CBS 7064]|uniref:Piso0_003833 protein n=1 Tax=Pichia sorbitophila (strain ATCC MYA-4447 / BCRC 22081 / CBS 7064 / NBRC 10061 / NRRL Y-12695) TaxID=559304 RepID=G8Y9M8_PICSO|nr:Piso0_003833 [Millerozyma farinosa CBS 7064]CCE84292.1 Piso0_003833 [Millerozyma farinosa CBS 7064]